MSRGRYGEEENFHTSETRGGTEFRPSRLESPSSSGGYGRQSPTGSHEGISDFSASKINVETKNLMNEDLKTFWQGKMGGVVRVNMGRVKSSYNEGTPKKEKEMEPLGDASNAQRKIMEVEENFQVGNPAHSRQSIYSHNGRAFDKEKGKETVQGGINSQQENFIMEESIRNGDYSLLKSRNENMGKSVAPNFFEQPLAKEGMGNKCLGAKVADMASAGIYVGAVATNKASVTCQKDSEM